MNVVRLGLHKSLKWVSRLLLENARLESLLEDFSVEKSEDDGI